MLKWEKWYYEWRGSSTNREAIRGAGSQGESVSLSPNPRPIWPTRSPLFFLPASKTLAHYSLLSFLPNLILSPSHIYSQRNVLPPNRNRLLSTFPFFWSSLFHSLMEISIDLGVKLLAWLSTWIFFALKPTPKRCSFLQITFKNKMLTILFPNNVAGTCVQSIPEQLSEEFSPTWALLILSRSIRCRHKCQALPGSYSSTLSISLSLHLSLFQSSINVISSCTCLHYDYFFPSLPLIALPCALAVLSFSFSFISILSFCSSPRQSCMNPSFCFHR